MIWPIIETEDLLLSIIKNCETLIKQIPMRSQETLKFKPSKSGITLPFEPPILIEGCWMKGLTNLEVYNSIFHITEENNKFELYTDNFDEFSFTELKDELEKILGFSDITPKHLQHDIVGKRIITKYEKLGSETSSTDGYNMLLMGCDRSRFRDFESYLRIIVCLNEKIT